MSAIGIACSSRELFGADRSAMRLAKVLQRLGHEVRLLVPEARPELGLTAYAEELGICVDAVPIAIASSSGVEGLLSRVRSRPQSSFDLVIYNTSAVLDVAVRTRGRVLMLREWLEPHNLRHRGLAAWHRRRMSAVVAISNGAARQWAATARSSTPLTIVIPNWLRELPAQSPQEVDKAGMLCIGRFNQWKGQEVLAEAYTAAFGSVSPGARPALTFVGAQGDGDFGVRSRAVALAGRDLWDVLPFTRDADAYFRAAALVVVPSLHPEPFGMVILEALRAGCRVLAFEGGGPDDLADAFPGVVICADRAEGLTVPLRDWWAEGGRAQTYSERLFVEERLRAMYSEDAAVASWSPVLDEVLP